MDIGRKRHVAYKFPVVCLEPIQQLMKLMNHDSLEGFRKEYGLILSFVTILSKNQHDALFTLLQFYDPPLRCFTFPDFILVPTLEEVASFLRVPIKPQSLFYSSKFLPDLNMSFLLGEAKKKLKDGDQRGFNAVLALCVYGIVLFPNVEKFVDVDAIRLFVLGNLVPTLLGDFFHSVHHRNENRRGGLVNFCAPLFYKWFSSHLPKSGAFVDVKNSLSWSKRLIGIRAKDISWWSDRNLLRADIIHSCGNFPNVPLVGRRGSINYNPSLAVRQFGYALRTPPLEKDVEESLFFHSSSDLIVSRKAAEAWLKVIKRGRTVLGKGDCRTYPQYEEWLQGRVEEFGLPFPIEEPLYPPTPEQSTMVSREEYDKLKNAMEELQTKNSELSVKLQDCMHQFHEAEYQKGEAVRLQEEAERKLVMEVDFFRKTDKALGSSSSELRRVKQQLIDVHGKLVGWQEQWDAFSASRKAKEEEMVAQLTVQMEKLKTLLKEKNNELLCARSTNGYITDQLNKAQEQIEELKVLAGLKKSRLEEVFGEDDGNYYREHIKELDGVIHKRNLLIRCLTESPDHPDTVALLAEVRSSPFGLYRCGVLILFGVPLARIADSGIHRYGTRRNQQRAMESLQVELSEMRIHMTQFMDVVQGVAQGQQELRQMMQRNPATTQPETLTDPPAGEVNGPSGPGPTPIPHVNSGQQPVHDDQDD
ncbi:hypothetical protein KIW84_021481 [Lathyrus oleraceus]|uniref:DUF7745 domain-containing protein n=1 Tax=Pisum sativum TaxID=3888 RepID=A0A9D4Y7Y1_PEA|nr:hypothetical protein KIW84_021481 [Pisum sativum]